MRLIPGFGKTPKPKQPPAPLPLPVDNTAEEEAARRRAREQERQRRGRAATVLGAEQRDDPLGVVARPQTGSGQRRATVLGG